MLYRTYNAPGRYPATLTFMIDQDEGGGSIGTVSAILGQFGLGGGGRSGKYNLTKMLQLAKSRRIITNVLFEKAEVDGKRDFIANHLISELDYHEKWAKKDSSKLKDFLFVTDSIEYFNRLENTVLLELSSRLTGGEETAGLIGSEIDDETGIMSLTSNTTNEDLSIQLTKILFEKLRDFYVNKSIERQKITYQIIRSKADSLENALNIAQARLLRFQDTNKGLTLLRYNAEKFRLEKEIQKLVLAYGESYKQLEIADFSLRNSTPAVQTIDVPIEPIRRRKGSLPRAFFLGAFIGIIISITLIIGRKVYQEIMT